MTAVQASFISGGSNVTEQIRIAQIQTVVFVYHLNYFMQFADRTLFLLQQLYIVEFIRGRMLEACVSDF